ncbi:hypothetical protein C0995_010876 [Termitomyces sp. Mi166|nr:hypothetical protein C0995_010876 [Termitomyces sp. Mi166\
MSPDNENTLTDFVGNADMHGICLKMLQAALGELHELRIHPKAHTDIITLAIYGLLNCFDPRKQEFSFEELDPDEAEEPQDSASQSVAGGSRPPIPGTHIITSTDADGNGVSETVSATGKGVHTRFLYSKESPIPPPSTFASVIATSTSNEGVKGKCKVTDHDNSDSGYESHNPVPNPKKRVHEDGGDDAQAARNTRNRPNKTGMGPDPGPPRPRAQPRDLRREHASYILPSYEDNVPYTKPTPAVSPISGASASAPGASTPPIASHSAVVGTPSPASSISSNGTTIFSPRASPTPAPNAQLTASVPSRRPRALRREYAFYIPRSAEERARDRRLRAAALASAQAFASPSAVASISSISAPVPSHSAVVSTSDPVRPPSPASSIASNGTTIFSPPAFPSTNLAAQFNPPSPISTQPSPRRTPKRARENDNGESRASTRVLRRKSE